MSDAYVRMSKLICERRKWKHVARYVSEYPGITSTAPPVNVFTGWEKVRRG